MIEKKRFGCTILTLKFCIAGFFIPGITAVFLLGLQQSIEFSGVECSKSWVILWTVTAVAMVVAPILFILFLKRKLHQGFSLTSGSLIVFNLGEYAFLQATLAMQFTSGKTLCYVTDGQNGLEFIFTGWMALPILVVLSLKFDTIKNNEINKRAEEAAGSSSDV